MTAFLIGSRVRLSQAGIDARIIRRGKRTGVIVGVKTNGGGTWVIVLRDGTIHEQPYAVEFWELDK